MKVTMVRHTAVDVPSGTCYGQTDVDVLHTFGPESLAVKALLEGVEYDFVYSSPLKRCVKLAQACGYCAPIVDNRLMELDFGAWEMQKWDEISDPRLQDYYSDYMRVAPTGGESFEMMRRRVHECLSDIRRKAGQEAHVLIFTHGGVIAATMIDVLGLECAEAFARQPRYGQAVSLVI